jgi:hypothetical protein
VVVVVETAEAAMEQPQKAAMALLCSVTQEARRLQRVERYPFQVVT